MRADDGVVGAGPEGDVDEGLLLEQRVEDREDGRAVVVPLQAELLLGRRTAPYCREKMLQFFFRSKFMVPNLVHYNEFEVYVNQAITHSTGI